MLPVKVNYYVREFPAKEGSNFWKTLPSILMLIKQLCKRLLLILEVQKNL